jgi:hypothetical protein
VNLILFRQLSDPESHVHVPNWVAITPADQQAFQSSVVLGTASSGVGTLMGGAMLASTSSPGM